jgi:hypothetical protein
MKGRKKYRIRTGARTASKVKEKELIQKAKKLRKNPDLVLPTCDESCRFCPFDKIRRQLDKISEYSDDEKALEKFTSKGDNIARAYAATLTLPLKGKIAYLAPFRTPFGEIHYWYKPGVKREKLIGVQYYDDPVLRMFGVLDIVKKKGLFIYSQNDKMVCTGRNPDPPKKFIDQMIESLKTSVKPVKIGDATIYVCPHLDAKKIKNESPAKNPYLKIDWLSADVTIGLCERCAKNSKENTYLKLVSRIAGKKVHDDFDIRTISKPLVDTKCSVCSDQNELNISEELFEKYKDGLISDQDLIETHQQDFKDELIGSSKKHYILDHVCYGTNLDTFIKKLEPEDIEKTALKVVLKKVPTAVVVSKATPNKVLSHYWKEYGREAIMSVTEDRDFSNKMFKKSDINKIPPSQILKDASYNFKHLNIIKALPSYDKLPIVAKFADEIARTYMTRGPEDAARAIEHYRSTDTRIKTVAFAFLLALNKGTSKQWQYTDTEKEFADYLKESALKLLNSEPEDYHTALQDLPRATGSTEQIKREDK